MPSPAHALSQPNDNNAGKPKHPHHARKKATSAQDKIRLESTAGADGF